MAEKIVANWNKHLQRQSKHEAPSPAQAQADAGYQDSHNEGTQTPLQGVSAAEDDRHDRKRLKSPGNSVKAGDRESSPSPVRRTKGRERQVTSKPEDDSSDFPSRPHPKTKGRLWNVGEPPPLTRGAAAAAATAQQQPAPSSSTRPPRRAGQGGSRPKDSAGPGTEDEDPSVHVMIKQPETRPISQEQLVAEVKGIYAGLVMVESKCIEVDSAQSSQSETAAKLNNEQWQALIALHRTLLHEHHDFFLASQHPSASPALRRLASKYAMPARMWRHGIHSFLELLRHRLPASLEHMLTFIYLAYSMMALLYETVPAFEDTWIECLGDLGRYRMAIEDEDIRDREIWTAVSRQWYSKASDKAPTTGRLHHHLAILARPNAVQQLFYYTKSLCVAIPFKSARDSILTLFDPILNGTQNRLQPVDLAFVKAHGILFIASNIDERERDAPKLLDDKEKAPHKPISELMSEYAETKCEFMSALDTHIAKASRSWLEPGAFVAISNSNSLLEYGKTDPNRAGGANVIMSAISPQLVQADVHMEGSAADVPPVEPSAIFTIASELVKECDLIVFQRYGDTNTLSYLNVRLSFMKLMADKPAAMGHLENSFPWTKLCLMLNSLMHGFEQYERIQSKEFPRPSEGQPDERPLPEDWSLRGLLWTDGVLYPQDWFGSHKVDEDEKTFELSSMTEIRRERVLWLAWNIASHGKWICYDEELKQFSPAPEFHQAAQDLPAGDMAPAEKDAALSRASTFDSIATTATLDADSLRGWKGASGASEADDTSMVVERSEDD